MHTFSDDYSEVKKILHDIMTVNVFPVSSQVPVDLSLIFDGLELEHHMHTIELLSSCT